MLQTKTKKLIAAVVATTLFAGVAVAVADSNDGHNGKRQTRMIEKISKELSLNDSQKEQLVVLTEEVRTQLREQREQAREKMQSLLAQENVSKEEVLQVMQSRQTGRAQMQELIAEKFVEFHALLDDAQKQKMAKFSPRLFNARGGHGKWFNRGGGDRHGGKHHGGYDDDDDSH